MTAPLPDVPLRLAAAAWPLDWHAGWSDMAAKLVHWIAAAASDGADLAVLPEYAGLEAAFTGPRTHLPTERWCERASGIAGRYAALCASLAQRHGLWLLSGSLPVHAKAGFVNRAYLCAPDGTVSAHDKQVLTPWERTETPLQAGAPLAPVVAGSLRLGVLICYDAEFPPLARALEADLLLIPSCTEAAHGDARVRTAARARALEGQAIAIHAPLLGGIPECAFVDANTGAAGIYGPPDTGFPPSGTLARHAPDAAGWLFADLDAGALSLTRNSGAVAPRAHMAEAERRAAAARNRPVHHVAFRPARQIAP